VKPLTKPAFAKWLKAQPEDAYFLPRVSKACPIARYIGAGASVGPDDYEVKGKDYPLPKWAKDYVERFDSHVDYEGCTKAGAIEALS
jgi:hypothetical protein